MQIPVNQPKRPPLELCSIKLYSTGLKKIYTNHFYKSMNHNFGVEIRIQNNTSRVQDIRIGGCIYDNYDNVVSRWGGTKHIRANSTASYDFYVQENVFSQMKSGQYKILFWINDKKVKNQSFTISYK